MPESPLEAPLVSVIIPAYNAAKFLPRTLSSILQQSYSQFEILVIDDGSTDETPHIVQSFVKQDPRIILLQQTNAGVAAARNLGIQAAQGEYIAPIDADDLWYPTAMEKMIKMFQSPEKTLGVVYAWSVDIDEYDRPLQGFHAASVSGDVYKTLICHNFLGNASSTLIKASCFDTVGGYNTEFRIQQAQGCEDWDLYLRLAEQYQFTCVPEFLVGYRNITGSMSGDFQQMARSQASMLLPLEKKYPTSHRFLYQLSYSSFYLYLAYQCAARGQTADTLDWLKKSVKTHASPLIRPGFYILLIKSLIQLIHPHRAPPSPRDNPSTQPKHIHREPQSDSERYYVPQKIPLNPVKVQLKLFVSMMLHQFLLRL